MAVRPGLDFNSSGYDDLNIWELSTQCQQVFFIILYFSGEGALFPKAVLRKNKEKFAFGMVLPINPDLFLTNRRWKLLLSSCSGCCQLAVLAIGVVRKGRTVLPR